MASFDSTFLGPFGHYHYPPPRKGCMPPLHKTPDYIRQQHRMFFNSLIPLEKANLFYTNTHQIDASTAPLKQLSRITLQDLHMEEATKGGYLLLRTIEPAYRMVAVTTIVEDHEGNAVLFAVYNFSMNFNSSVDVLFPVGTIFILKEPYIKMSKSKDCMLRCDCPTDMIIMHEGHKLFSLTEGITWKNTPNPEPVNPVSVSPKPKTAMEWKARGNALFNEQKYEYATQCYLLALQEAERVNNDEDLLIMRLNLSAAYLQRGFFETALEYARAVLGFDPGNGKALLRAGRSCYQLRKYKVAQGYFEVFHRLYPDYEDGTKELDECRKRISEQETGEFNMYKMYLERAYKPGQNIDCADYVGPVKVVDISGKGRGVVATRDLGPGTLVAVSKALAFSWDNTNEIRMQFNTDQTVQFGNDIKLVTQITQMIARNPNTFGSVIYHLFDGQSNSDAGNLNLFCDPKTKEEPIADVDKIRKILNNNCFMSPYDHSEGMENAIQNCPDGSGLFLFPSYFNHSCVPNANWLMFNDVMVIRIRQFTEAGQEVLLSYIPWETDYEIRNTLCISRGFQCLCNFCNFERADSQHMKVKRKKYIWTFRTKFEKQIINGNVNAALINRLKKMMKTFDMTYENTELSFPKLDKLPFYYYLAMAYKCQGNRKEQILCYKEVIHEYGFNAEQLLSSLENKNTLNLSKNAMLCQRVLYYFEKIVHVYHEQGDTANLQKWIKLLVALEKLYSGGDTNVIKLKYCHIKHLF